MSHDIVTNYASILSEALKSKSYEKVIEIFNDEFSAKAKLMGREYQFDTKEKFEKFLSGLPGGINVTVNEIKSIDNQFVLSTKMGLGMLKIPSQWIIRLDDNNKITYFEIK